MNVNEILHTSWVSITYGVRAEVQMESVLWKSENRNRNNIEEIMQLERNKCNRS